MTQITFKQGDEEITVTSKKSVETFEDFRNLSRLLEDAVLHSLGIDQEWQVLVKKFKEKTD